MLRPASALCLCVLAALPACSGLPAALSRLPSEHGGPLEVQWRRLLTEPPLVEYKPQEFASATTDGTFVFVGSKGGSLWALRPLDGGEGWRKHIPGGVSSRPLYLPESRTVLVGGDDGVLYGLDARTGNERFTYRTKGPIGGTPVFADGLIYFANGESRIYAIDAATGAWRWQYEREAPETFTIRGIGTPLAHGGRVYAGFSDGHLAALNARTGEVIWARSLAGDATRFVDVDAPPVIEGDTLYAASYSGGLYAMDPASGDVKWRFAAEGATSVQVSGDRVYFAATRTGVHCLDLQGRIVWRQGLAAQGELSAISLLRDRYLLVSAADAGTYVVDARSGTLLQFFRPGKGVPAPPSSDGNSVFVLTNTGWFYSFALSG